MNLLDTPQDVLLKILYKLEVQDLLRVERTCRTLREYILHDSKHLWLVKLHDLDVSCAPGISPNVSVEDLSITELRRIVIRAVRQYIGMTSANSPSISYVLRKTLNPSPPRPTPNNASICISQAKLIPGGRFLFVSWMARVAPSGPTLYSNRYDRSEELCIIDTENSSRRVWSYDPGDYHKKERRFIYGFHFDVQKDGTIILAVMTESDDDGVNGELTGLLQIFRLSFDSGKKEFDASPVYSSDRRVYRHRCCAGGTDCQVSGDCVALINYADRIITLIKCDERKVGEITFARTADRGRYRIWRDHLFYMEFALQEIRAVSITEAMSSTTEVMPKLEELNTITLQLDAVPDKHGTIISGSSSSVEYSICDAPWKGTPEAILTILSQVTSYLPHYTATRVKFHPLGPGSQEWAWTFLSAKTAKSPDCDNRTSYFSGGAVRSGRFLSWSQKSIDFSTMVALSRDDPLLLRRLDLIAVDREGRPIFPQLSDNMAHLLARAKEESEYTKGHDDGSVFRTPAHVERIEEYSGAIVVVRDVWSGKDFVEIYYPE